MKKTAIALTSAAFILALSLPAQAQWRGHGGGYHGGFHGGHMGMHRGYMGMHRPMMGMHRGFMGHPVARGAYWNNRMHGNWAGNWSGHHHHGSGWGWAAAGAGAALIGSALAYPYYGSYGGYYYADPCYDYYSSYRPYYCY